MAHAQQIALALYERGWLEAFVTTHCFRRQGYADRISGLLPAETSRRVADALGRRRVDSVPERLVHTRPWGELARTVVEKAGGGRALVDRLWERCSHGFDRHVASRHVAGAEAIHAFEYTALASFERAADAGAMRVLHLPAPDNEEVREIVRREVERWPGLKATDDPCIDKRFQSRQARRRREIELADLIVCNSALTARSHMRAGADPSKVRVVRLGAPPPIAEVRSDPQRCRRALGVVFAGPFSVRKGAPYLIEAWRRLAAGRAARLDIYGSLQVPGQLVAAAGDGVRLHGSVTAPALRGAFEKADVLVLPSLADGFGMVVTEAMACGLPVIVTDQVGAAELVTPANGRVVPGGDVAALTNALQWCLDNRSVLEGMRNGALEQARRRPWSDFRRELISLLDKAVVADGAPVWVPVHA